MKIFVNKLEEKKASMNIRSRLNRGRGENLYNIMRRNKKRKKLNSDK